MGLTIANSFPALLIACGQNVANVVESAVGYTYSEISPNDDYYFFNRRSYCIAVGTGLAKQ